MFRRLLLAGLAGLTLVLAACGGGGGGEPTASPTPAATATPPTVAVPTPPSEFTGYPDAIAGYLTETEGSPSCLAELFAAWGMPEPTFGPPCAAADLDGDGDDEYVVRIADAAIPESPLSETPPPMTGPTSYEGDILILDSSRDGYEVVFRASARDGLSVVLNQPSWGRTTTTTTARRKRRSPAARAAPTPA